MPLTVEICVEGAVAAVAASQGGADRVELCSHLAVGGVTPSAGAIAVACAQLTIPVHVLVRPRGGDFVVSPLERAEMRHDILTCKRLGAAGVVLGGLTPEGTVDRHVVAEHLEIARPMSVTFHRAFDVVRDPLEALEALIELGVDRILTSGRGRPAREALPLLQTLVERAHGRLIVLAGGSVAMADLGPLAQAGLSEVHIGSAAFRDDKTDVEKVRELVEHAHRL
jgi:copper homeostasis protein